jgi:membrane-associated protease RseP (regulator of RpoE activity)
MSSRVFWLSTVGLAVLAAVVAGSIAQERSAGAGSAGSDAAKAGADANANTNANTNKNTKANAGADTEAEGPTSEPGPVKLGEYWVGVQCYALHDAKGEGVGVASVVPGGPADAAGIRQHDTIVRAGSHPIRKIQELVDAVEQAQGKPLAVELRRDGKSQTVTVTPEKRPEGAELSRSLPMSDDPDWRRLEQWLEQMRPGAHPGGPMRFRFLQPGTLIPPGTPVRPPLPENMTIVITKTGADPARVVVKRGGETWETTEEELGKLPEDVRTHVERLLGRAGGGWIGKSPLPGELQQFDIVPDWPGGGPNVPSTEMLERRFEEHFNRMHQKLDELHKALEKAQQPAEKAEPGEDSQK